MVSPLQARHHRLGKIWNFCSPLPFHFLVSTFTLFPPLLPPPPPPLLSPSHPAPCLNVWPCMRQHDFSERSLVPPVGTLAWSCSGGLRLPHFPPFSSNAPSVVATTAYMCKLCVCLNRSDGAGMWQTEQCLMSNSVNRKTCSNVLIHCVFCWIKHLVWLKELSGLFAT